MNDFYSTLLFYSFVFIREILYRGGVKEKFFPDYIYPNELITCGVEFISI